MQRFARRVGSDDAALVEEYGYRLVDEARAAKFGALRTDPDSPYYDPEAAKFAADIDEARSGDSDGGFKAPKGGRGAVAPKGKDEEEAERNHASPGAGLKEGACDERYGQGEMESGKEWGKDGQGSDSLDADGAVNSDSAAATSAIESALQKRLLRRRKRKG